jgi:hypothetical protein
LVISSKKNQPACKALSRSAPFVPPHWNANCSWTSLALTEMKNEKLVSDKRGLSLNYFRLSLCFDEKILPFPTSIIIFNTHDAMMSKLVI